MNGKFIKRKIEEAGIPLVTIAERMKVQPQRMQAIFNVGDVKVGLLHKIAEAMDKDILYFLSDEIGALDLSGKRRVLALPKVPIDGNVDESIKISVVQHENEDLTDSIAIEMDNDRMEPTIPIGATVLFNKLDKEEDIDYFVGVCCLIVKNRAMVGRVTENNVAEGDTLSISFDNSKYGRMHIKVKDIHKMYVADRIISAKIK